MATLSSISHYRQPRVLVPTNSATLTPPAQTSKYIPNLKIHDQVASGRRYSFSTKGLGMIGAPTRHRNGIICRAGAQDTYGHCKCTEDAVMAIMKDAIQHCLNKECDVMRDKVLNQMGQGLAALCRVSVGVAAESSTGASIPIPIPDQLSTIKVEDLEQVRRMLQLTALPFNSSDDEDLKRVMKMLQTGNGKDIANTLSGSELSQICERLGSDLVQCLGPLVMCFPELPLWAKHRALLLPAEVAAKMAFSLLTGPNGR